ncbi:uncharacterized protein LOC125943261 isoform X2 [Dermacentor silvarum]|uniref:uncharacterized protein LOC125943261 isoform X2 n=1 Tax=Dermacentor silvarum TaxID=543639 RepID=UPI0021013D86|nr:uncharacterized protein LOC125943261 isoform X2 [Dermacentor silvarum]
MRLMAGDSFILFFGLTLVNTGDHFPADKTAYVIKGITSNVNLVIVRSDNVETEACDPQPLSVWQPVRGCPIKTPSTISHSKLILMNLTSLKGTIVAMSSNMALKVYNIVANSNMGAQYLSHRNSSEDDVSGRIACSAKMLCIAEIKNVVMDMPKDTEAILGWTLVDMNFEDSVGRKCPLYTESTDAFARTKAVRRELGKQHRYALRKLLEPY